MKKIVSQDPTTEMLRAANALGIDTYAAMKTWAVMFNAAPLTDGISKMLIAVENAGFQMANYESTVASDAYDPVKAGSRIRDFKNAIADIEAALSKATA